MIATQTQKERKIGQSNNPVIATLELISKKLWIQGNVESAHMFGEDVVEYYVPEKGGIAVVHSFFKSNNGRFHAWYVYLSDIHMPPRHMMSPSERFRTFTEFTDCPGVQHALILQEGFFDSPMRISVKKEPHFWKRVLKGILGQQ